MFTHEAPLSRPRLIVAVVILTVAVLLGSFVDAHGAGAAASRTPRSCKVAIRDAQKAITVGAHIIGTLSDVVQMMPKALIAAATNDGDTLTSMTATINEKTQSIKDDTAKINALKDEFQSNRDACLNG